MNQYEEYIIKSLKIFQKKIQTRTKLTYFKNDFRYHDNTASGVLIRPVEDFLTKHVYPYYANTHSNSFGGQLMKHYIQITRRIIKNHLKITDNNKIKFKILFTGQGMSGALIHLLSLLKLTKNDTIFISDMEHHSNYLPWIEYSKLIGFKVHVVNSKDGIIDSNDYSNKLKSAYGRVIASFIHASNITGIVQPVELLYTITKKIKSDSLFILDCATSFSSIIPNSNYFDAIIFSGHKLIGGPGSPGILVFKEEITKNKDSCPLYCSGGTIRFVTEDHCVYSNDTETKESGGTPNIIGIIKIGLSLILKEVLSQNKINFDNIVFSILPNFGIVNGNVLEVLELNGMKQYPHLPIYSFRIKSLTKGYYHSNLIVAILSDKFGIQTRGGISCSSLYAQKLLLNNDPIKIKQHENYILKTSSYQNDYGFVRFSFSKLNSKNDVNFLLNAIKFVLTNIAVLEKNYIFIQSKNLYQLK